MFWSLFAACLVMPPQQTAARDLAKSHLETKQVVGMSVAVSVNGELVFNEGFGWKDRENKVAASKDTQYRLGSVSKPVAAIALMREVEANRLDLDKDVREYVKEWPADKPGITLRRIMTHTSGIRHYKLMEGVVKTHFPTAVSALSLFKDDALIAPTGTKYSYSTHAWTLAAAVLESASGKSFPDAISDLAGADSTLRCEDLTQKLSPNYSELYGRVGANPPHFTTREDNSWKYAGGGMISTAGDLAVFGNSFMTGKLVLPATVNLMLTPVGGVAGDGQGLAWRVNGSKFNHTGAQQGCSAAMFCDRASGTVVVVLCNTESAGPAELAQKLLPLWQPKAER